MSFMALDRRRDISMADELGRMLLLSVSGVAARKESVNSFLD